MKGTLLKLVFATTVLLLLTGIMTAGGAADLSDAATAWQKMPAHPLHTDHSTFFQAPFADGPSVPRACLQCHPQASREVMQTAHWNWQGEEVIISGHDEPVRIGKRNVINNF